MRDFSFNSGERQTSQTLENIRYDHLARYILAGNILKNMGKILCERENTFFQA